MMFCSNTVGGDFGDGESKVVRNLTKPPMVNSILEFISESLVFDLNICSRISIRAQIFFYITLQTSLSLYTQPCTPFANQLACTHANFDPKIPN
jgi:hypothetical protein